MQPSILILLQSLLNFIGRNFRKIWCRPISLLQNGAKWQSTVQNLEFLIVYKNGVMIYIFNCNQRNHPELLWQAYCFWQFLGFVVGWSIGNFHFCMTICIKPTVLFLCKQVGIRKYFLLQGVSRYLMVN